MRYLQHFDNNELATMFEKCYPLKSEKSLVVELMKRGFDWRSFAGLTRQSLCEILDMDMKPGDIYYGTHCGVRLYGSKTHQKNYKN